MINRFQFCFNFAFKFDLRRSAAVEDDDGNFFYGGEPALLCNFLGILFQSLVGPAGCCSPRQRMPVI